MKRAIYEKIKLCLGGGRILSSNRKGFTLAEVLVTLGIIGVVSAMTVPSLMQNYQRQSYVTQLHKFYNELSQALVRYQNDSNAVNLREAGLNSRAALYDFFKNYFKIVNDCGNTQTPCFASDYKNLSGVKSGFNCSSNCVLLASGSSLGATFPNKSNIISEVVVDINGPKGPNIFGRDAFTIYIYNNNVLDDLALENPDTDGDGTWSTTSTAPLSKEQRETNFKKACLNNPSGFWHGCFGKILNDNWEMNY